MTGAERWGAFPLGGKRIVVTRARAQAPELAERLEALGAEAIRAPAIRVLPAADPAPLRRAARAAASFDWIVFTSANGVARFWEALEEDGNPRPLAGVSVCAVGPATAAALAARGCRADLVPERYLAESVLDALEAATELAGRRVLLPRGQLARPVLPDGLRARGAQVVEVVAYHTVPDAEAASRLRERLAAGTVDVVTFTSSSTVQNFVERVGGELGGARVASIGPITSATARRLGLRVDIEAEEYTTSGLVAAIVAFYRDREHGSS